MSLGICVVSQHILLLNVFWSIQDFSPFQNKSSKRMGHGCGAMERSIYFCSIFDKKRVFDACPILGMSCPHVSSGMEYRRGQPPGLAWIVSTAKSRKLSMILKRTIHFCIYTLCIHMLNCTCNMSVLSVPRGEWQTRKRQRRLSRRNWKQQLRLR